jgi:hypothetical protein
MWRPPDTVGHPGDRRKQSAPDAAPRRQLGHVEAEIERLTRRLVALLDGDPEGLASKIPDPS